MSLEKRSSRTETDAISEVTKKVESNRHRRIQQYDIAMLRTMGVDRTFQMLEEKYRHMYPDIDFRILRPLITPDDINTDRLPNSALRASFNFFFNFGNYTKGKSGNQDVIGREASRAGLMVVRGDTLRPIALEIFGNTSEVIPLEAVKGDVVLESISHAVRNPLEDVEPRAADLSFVRPRIVDVNPYSKKFVKIF